jgi:hypothetical protein
VRAINLLFRIKRVVQSQSTTMSEGRTWNDTDSSSSGQRGECRGFGSNAMRGERKSAE